MKYFNEKSKVIILTYIQIISYEYEYFGSARTLVTKSTRDHTASLFCFIQDRSITRSLQRWSFDEILDLAADVFLFYSNCYRETIHDCSYIRERIMSSLSLQQYPVGDSHNSNNGICVEQMVPETRYRSIYRRRPRVEACGTW